MRRALFVNNCRPFKSGGGFRVAFQTVVGTPQILVGCDKTSSCFAIPAYKLTRYSSKAIAF